MEWLESLFPLLLLLIYFLAQARKRGAKRRAAAAETPTVETPAAETPGVQQSKRLTPFQEILRQIQEAAEQTQAEKARAEQQEQASGAPNTVVATPTPEVVLPPAPSLDTFDFHKQGEFEHDEHGFGVENPFSEERFEIQPASPPPPAHAPGHLDYDPHESVGDFLAPRIMGRKPHPLVKSLQNSSGLKEALILKEILDPPSSRRRAPRRSGMPRR